MSDLHPDVEPYECGHLDVSDGNFLYWETVGNPTGVPVVYLHGVAGVRLHPRCAEVADIERLRNHLGIDGWIIAGVSWGVTLGSAYAQAHPDRVLGMASGAITSGSSKEIDWITRDMRRVFPREWERFIEPVPENERDGNIAAASPGIRTPSSEWCSRDWSLTIGATTASSWIRGCTTGWEGWRMCLPYSSTLRRVGYPPWRIERGGAAALCGPVADQLASSFSRSSSRLPGSAV